MTPPRRILLVVDRCGLGDALRVRGLVDRVRRAEPRATLSVVAGQSAAQAFWSVAGIDQFLVSRLHAPGRWPQPLRVVLWVAELARLRLRLGRRFDVAIVFQWGSTAADLLAALAARRRYGYENRAPGLLLSCRLGPYAAGDERTQNLELLRLAGVQGGEPDADGGAPWARGDRDAVLRLLADRGVTDPTQLVVVHAGSDWACQQWPPERWAVLVRHLWRRYRAELVFTGTARDAAHVGQIRAMSAVPTVSLTGETSLGMLAALLSMARLCVCVDSAAYEVAQLSGVPTVVLASPTSADPLPGTPSRPVVVNPTPMPERFAIGQCQHDMGGHGCADWTCRRAGLPLIEIGDVVRAVRRAGVLVPAAAR